MSVKGYNERLFRAGSLRVLYHQQRFQWVRDVLRRLNLNPASVVELGCFDGRLLDNLPSLPSTYVGLDAGWEGGLNLAQSTRATNSIRFLCSTDPVDLSRFPEGSFSLGVAIETMEHISPQLIDDYIAQLSRIVDGHLLVSVPNEKGVPLLLRQSVKSLMSWNEEGSSDKYTAREFLDGVLGRMDRIARHEHKGFDYDALVRQIAKRFEIASVEGIPSRALPPSLSFSVGIVARTARARRDL